jgi:hypothetical protein
MMTTAAHWIGNGWDAKGWGQLDRDYPTISTGTVASETNSPLFSNMLVLSLYISLSLYSTLFPTLLYFKYLYASYIIPNNLPPSPSPSLFSFSYSSLFSLSLSQPSLSFFSCPLTLLSTLSLFIVLYIHLWLLSEGDSRCVREPSREMGKRQGRVQVR